MSGREDRGGGGGSSSSSSREERSGSSDKKEAKKKEQDLKADILEFVKTGISSFLKGSPPQARESGLILQLHTTRYKDTKEAKNRGTASKARGSARSVSSNSSTGSSTRASSSDRRHSSSSSSSSHGHHSNRNRHSSIQRPWQVHGDATPDMEVQYGEEAELAEPAGTAEANYCAEKVRAILKKSRLGAWINLKKELDVQRMIWESLSLGRRAPDKDKDKKEVIDTPETRIIAEFEQALKASSTDADNAVRLLEDIIERDAKGSKLLSNSVLAKSQGCIKAELVAGKHRTLEQWLIDAGQRGPRHKKASPDAAEDVSEDKDKTEKIYTVQELSELLLACELKDNILVYCICRVLSWLAGAPQSGAALTMAMGTADPGDADDPYTYFPPDPSVSPPGSNENSGEGGPRRLDLTSLQQKQKKGKADGNSNKEEAEPTSPKTVEVVRSPPPSLPPPAKLPDFPRYPLSDPMSMIPLASYPTGLAKDLHADERSTTAGSKGEARSVGSDATCGSWDGEHRASIFLSL